MLKTLNSDFLDCEDTLKEDLVNNGYSPFAEEIISKPRYAEEQWRVGQGGQGGSGPQ